VDGVWTPSATILAALESRIDKISNLKSKSGNTTVRIKDPRQSYRQYVGILVGGQQYIYVNGMCQKFRRDLHDELQDVCDGGACFWGALYNVQSGIFSDLEANGPG
jgi:hypothetical protein